MLFLIGVAMLIAGVWLLIQGEVKLIGGRKVQSLPAQVAGLVMVSFLPLYFLAFIFIQGQDDLVKQGVGWSLAILCLITPLIILCRASKPIKATRGYSRTISASSAFYVDDGAASDSTAEAEAFIPEPPKTKKNPFDFS